MYNTQTLYTLIQNRDTDGAELHPVKRIEKKYKVFSQHGKNAVLWQSKIWVARLAGNPNLRLLLGGKEKMVFFQRREDTEVTLHSAGIVVVNVAVDHMSEFPSAGKTPAIVALPLEDASKALHMEVT